MLASDIGTDVLPALALGADPRPATCSNDPRSSVTWSIGLLVRVFGVLGPAEAVVEMAAFVATFLAVGWRPGETFPTGADLMAAASGAAFMAVVVGQCANAFACRSSTRWVGQMPLASNRLLVWAVAAELVALALFLGFEPVADVLDQAVPSLAGAAVASAGGASRHRGRCGPQVVSGATPGRVSRRSVIRRPVAREPRPTRTPPCARGGLGAHDP